MTDHSTDSALDERLRAADPVSPGSLPTAAETEVALSRLLGSSGGLEPRARAAPRRWRPRMPRVLAGTTVGLAALAALVVVLFSATSTPPAFAVTRNHNGTVTVKLLRLSGVRPANVKLAALGVAARIVVPAVADAGVLSQLQPCQGQKIATVRTITFNPAGIPSRHVLLLAADRAAHIRYFTAPKAASLPVPNLRLQRQRIRGTVPVRIGKALRAARTTVRKAVQGLIKVPAPVPGAVKATIARARNQALHVYCGRSVPLRPPLPSHTVKAPCTRWRDPDVCPVGGPHRAHVCRSGNPNPAFG
jgi:hypothetical protein